MKKFKAIGNNTTQRWKSLTLVMAVAVMAFALSAPLNLVKLNASSGVEVEIVDETTSSPEVRVDGNEIEAISPSGGSNSSGGSGGLGGNEIVKEIMGEKTNSGKLFGFDKFKPTDTDTSWADPIIKGVSYLASIACTAYGALILVQFLVDAICLLWSGFGLILGKLGLSWLYSDTVAALQQFPVQEGRIVPTIENAPTILSGKFRYWIVDAIITAVFGGAILAGVATGLLPTFIELCINIILNIGSWAVGKVKSL